MGFFGNNGKYFNATLGPGGPGIKDHGLDIQTARGNNEAWTAASMGMGFTKGQRSAKEIAAFEAQNKKASEEGRNNFAWYSRDPAFATADYATTDEELLRSAGFTLAWQHVPTGRSIEFKAFLEQISDAFTTNWQTESVYGRMDEIATYQNTVRSIAVLWHIPSASVYDAIMNMQNIQHLMQFLYPVYDHEGIIAAPPLMRLRFGNLIRNAYDGGGLLGHVNGFTVDPDPDAGWFTLAKGPMTGGPELYPKAVRLNCDFMVLHEHDLGFEKTKNGYMFRGGSNDENSPTGIDFPWPAGAGNPEIAGRDIPSKNSHLAEGVKPTDEDKIKNRDHFRKVSHKGQAGALNALKPTK